MVKQSLRVSIVDDEPSVRNALTRLLKAQSFEATAFASAAAFLDSLAVAVPDCLVVDFHMPKMTGLELQLFLRKAGTSIPTVVITAHDDAQLRQQCTAAGANAFLVKPITNTALVGAINMAIGASVNVPSSLQ